MQWQLSITTPKPTIVLSPKPMLPYQSQGTVWRTMSSCYTVWDGRKTQSRGMRFESTLWQSLWWRVSCQGVLFEWQHCRQAYISLLMVNVLAWRPTYWTSWNEKFCKLTIRIKTVVMSLEPTRLDCVGRRLEVEVRSQDWQGCCEVAEGWMPVRWDGQQNYFVNFFQVIANRVGVWSSDKKFIRNSKFKIYNFLFCVDLLRLNFYLHHHHLPFKYSAVSVPVQIHSYSIITTFGKQRCHTLGCCYKDVVPQNWPRTWGLGMNEWKKHGVGRQWSWTQYECESPSLSN